MTKRGIGFEPLDLPSRRPIPKSYVSLITVSVRSARPSLWYCLQRVTPNTAGCDPVDRALDPIGEVIEPLGRGAVVSVVDETAPSRLAA